MIKTQGFTLPDKKIIVAESENNLNLEQSQACIAKVAETKTIKEDKLTNSPKIYSKI